MTIPDKPFNEFLEDTMNYIYTHDVTCFGIVIVQPDGDVATAYYNATAADKATMCHNIQSDIVMDIIKNNIGLIREMEEDAE